MTSPPQHGAWSAVYALSFGVFGLITAEFLPMSLLTPMAAELGITEGLAGQAVTATAAVALVTGLLIATLTRGIDRRHVLLGFSVLLIVSNILVATASGMVPLLAGRLLLGIAIGGFWTMSSAVAMRLVPAADVPKALSLIFAGVSFATVVAAPLGSWLGDAIGWRGVFWLATALGVIGLLAQLPTLPSMPPTGRARLRTLAELVVRPHIAIGLVTVLMVFTGHFAMFTFIRPFTETALGADVTGVTLYLLAFGIANVFGTWLAGPMLTRSLRGTLAAMPLLAGAAGLALSQADGGSALTYALVALWGMAFGGIPVAWTNWVTRAAPEEAESAGGLIVASIQFAISLGAGLGGMIFDASGARGTYLAAGIVLLAAGGLALSFVRPRQVVAG